MAAFLLIVVLPTLSYSWYLWSRAADQYESDIGFGSRTEEGPSTFNFVGALTGAGQTGSKDMDILNQFVVSQELVTKIDAELDLKAIWSKPAADPLNAFHKDGTIEDLVSYWERMVLVDYDTATGLMNLRVFAFDPADAQRIANSILRESTAIINQLSQTAQEDTTRYSKQMLAETEQKLAAARLAVLDYQVKNNIVDPSNVVSNQLTVVATLVQELANTQVELDMLEGTVPEGDPRVSIMRRRLEVIENRIAAERAKVGAASSPDQPGYATLLAEFERLKVEQDFAQQAYLSALAAHDQALADAQKKTRYLATYVAPTLAEAPTAPNRPVHAALAALIGFLIWSVTVLTYYALRDRR
jgi:capsular polysaccharide transport system permease protein